MDYSGQKLSELLYYIVIILTGAIFWVVGYMTGDFQTTVYGWFCGLVVALLLCIPDWPMYNRKPVQWLGSIPVEHTRKSQKVQ